MLPSLANAPNVFFAKINELIAFGHSLETPLFIHNNNYPFNFTPTIPPEFNGEKH